MSLVLRAFVLLAPLLSLVASAATLPTTALTVRSIDEPLDAQSTYMRYTARENALHKPVARETNADRLRRGLPPLAPFRKPTKTNHHPSSSSSACSGKVSARVHSCPG